MAATSTLAAVKLAMRITGNSLDDEITSQINACLADLNMCGVAVVERDVLIQSSIKLWCLQAMERDPARAAMYRDRYDKQKACLMMAADYGQVN